MRKNDVIVKILRVIESVLGVMFFCCLSGMNNPDTLYANVIASTFCLLGIVICMWLEGIYWK